MARLAISIIVLALAACTDPLALPSSDPDVAGVVTGVHAGDRLRVQVQEGAPHYPDVIVINVVRDPVGRTDGATYRLTVDQVEVGDAITAWLDNVELRSDPPQYVARALSVHR